jgi:hypothetical protein
MFGSFIKLVSKQVCPFQRIKNIQHQRGHIDGLCFHQRTWALGSRPSLSHYSTQTLKNNIVYYMPRPDFHETLPLFGTYEIGP